MRRVATGAVAVLAAWLLAVAPYQVWMAQEVRMYPFVELGAVLVLLGSCLARERHALGATVVALGTALALGSHYLGACVAGLTLAVGSNWKERRYAALGAALGMLVWVPWLLVSLRDQMQSGWGDTVKLSARDLAELGPRLFVVEMDAVPARWRGIAYALGALCWGALARCAWLARTERAARIALLAAILPVLFALLTQATVGGGFQARYLIAATPGAALAVACGLAFRGTWLLGATGATLALGLLSHALVLRHYLRDREDILASLSSWSWIEARLEESLPAGARLHVVYRDSGYAWSARHQLSQRLVLVEAGPMRERIERSLWRRER